MQQISEQQIKAMNDEIVQAKLSLADMSQKFLESDGSLRQLNQYINNIAEAVGANKESDLLQQIVTKITTPESTVKEIAVLLDIPTEEGVDLGKLLTKVKQLSKKK